MSEYYLTNDELYHHGILGQKWGLRRWQNEDGTLTPAGREHYGNGARAEYKNRIGVAKTNFKNNTSNEIKKFEGRYNYLAKNYNKLSDKEKKEFGKLTNKIESITTKGMKDYRSEKKAAKEEYKKSEEYKKERLKKAAIIGASAIGTALAAYGAYKVIDGKIKNGRAYDAMLRGMQLADQNYYFNAPSSTIARTSGLTGKTYYKLKNVFGETIQTGKANSLDDLQKIRDQRYYSAAADKSKAYAKLRGQYMDTVSGNTLDNKKYLKQLSAAVNSKRK